MASKKSHIPGQGDQSITHGSVAHDLPKFVANGAVFRVAPGAHSESVPAREVVPAKVVHRRTGRDLQLGRNAFQAYVQYDFSAPALIVAADQFAEDRKSTRL